MSTPIKHIDIAEFRAEGYLQELNRRFLHPLGLALEVVVDDETGVESLGAVWDCRSDLEGVWFGGELDRHKARHIDVLWAQRASKREEKLGFVVEPLTGGGA